MEEKELQKISDNKKLIVTKIKNGTVIDRIPPGKALSVLKILDIDSNYPYTIALAMRVESRKMGLKDVVKIKGKELSKKEQQKLSFIIPRSTINIIKDYEVKEKILLQIPKHVEGFIKCLNPNCISNGREPISPSFDVISTEPQILRCKYCDRFIEGKNLTDQI